LAIKYKIYQGWLVTKTISNKILKNKIISEFQRITILILIISMMLIIMILIAEININKNIF